MTRHTIVLAQFTSSRSSRTYADFETIEAALDGICHLFEQRLRSELRVDDGCELSYSIDDLYKYIDGIPDLGVLVLDDDGRYLPRNKAWVKNQLLKHLEQIASS